MLVMVVVRVMGVRPLEMLSVRVSFGLGVVVSIMAAVDVLALFLA